MLDAKCEMILNEYDEEAPLVSKENTFAININNLVNLDSHQYYYSLAKLSFLLAEEAYPWATILKKTGDSYTKTEMLKEMSMMDYMSIVLDPSEYTEDIDDIIAFNIGYSYLKTNNKNYNIVVVSFRGTYDDVEWNSNFDIGTSEVSAYSEKEKHSEWINKKNHKGFDVASNRAITEMNNYLSNKLQDDAEKNIYLFTGHSRGGAMTNVLARYMQDNDMKYNAYAFACPNTTEEDETKCASYKNLFNICNN